MKPSKSLRKILCLICTCTLLIGTFMTSCGKKDTVYTIGVLQYGQHASLDNCYNGFVDGLKEAGLVEGADYKIDYQNASFDDSICTQIAQSFASRKVNMMCGIATSAAIACYSAAKNSNTPVVFTAINDPVQAKLNSGNVTGTSDKLPIDTQLDLIRKLMPNAKKIGIIYSTSEVNSISTIAEYKAKAPKYGFEIIDKGISVQSDVAFATSSLVNTVDCFSNLTDNTVVGALADILKQTNEKNIPVFGSEIEQVKLGCVAAAGIDYVSLGKQTGAMAAKIIKGEAKASDIPYETISEYGIYVNSNALAKIGLNVPDDIKSKAIEASNS